MTSVVVAVLTYRRPQDLAAVLPLVVQQAGACEPPARVLVVDNDAEGSAREAVEAWATDRVSYVCEPRPGIAAARNRALAEAAGDDVLVFLDDDERPGPGWLQHLLETRAATGCAGVVGPVVSSFAAPPDPWIAAGRFFDRRRLPTGTVLDVAATNNLLLDLRQVRAAGTAFDERFGLSGGSDTLFTRQLVAAGLRLLWCDEAVVTDVVPPSRATRSWVLRRALRSGNGWVRVALAMTPSAAGRARVRAVLTARGTVRAAGGGGRLLLGALVGRVDLRARGLRTAARGTGMLLGACGWTYVEYRRPAAAAVGAGARA